MTAEDRAHKIAHLTYQRLLFRPMERRDEVHLRRLIADALLEAEGKRPPAKESKKTAARV